MRAFFINLIEMKLRTSQKTLIADTLTPVSIYLRLRDKYANSFLLESSDYRGVENSFSYVCCEAISTFTVQGDQLKIKYPDGSSEDKKCSGEIVDELKKFKDTFEIDETNNGHIQNGLFGYMSYEAVRHFEDISLKNSSDTIPEVHYSIFKYVIAIDHFRNRMHIYEHLIPGEQSGLQSFINLLQFGASPSFSFARKGPEKSNLTDQEYINIVEKCISHCQRGDVFQIVPSRRFENEFTGDDFNVYRALRSVNPSPYLFYFDFGNYKIFGSSPEAQMVIKDGKASIHPIAGTFKRTGDDDADRKAAALLREDEKENAEHVMLVDLARNDLSINSSDVELAVYKEIQFYSHVIHLVSQVTGKLNQGVNPLQLVADTFPAGTLTGAPKYKAMQLIDEYETVPRSYYGGAIGFIGFNDEFNHAIMIRSFLSQNNVLYYQAGAGVVSKSVPENELNEVNNKLLALKKALEQAEQIDK